MSERTFEWCSHCKTSTRHDSIREGVVWTRVCYNCKKGSNRAVYFNTPTKRGGRRHIPLEKHIKKAIVKALRARGCFVYVTPPFSRGNPDLLVCFNGRFYGIEVKRPGGLPTATQKEVGALIEAAGGTWAVAYSAEDAYNIIMKEEQE